MDGIAVDLVRDVLRGVLLVAIVALGIGAALGRCTGPRAVARTSPAVEQATAVLAQAPSEKRLLDSLAGVIASAERRERSHRKADSAAAAEAATMRRLADSAAAAAAEAKTARDSAAFWQLAHERRTEEAFQLARRLEQKDAQLLERGVQLDAALAAEAKLQRRVIDLHSSLADVRTELLTSEPPCRIGPLPCPSRKAVLIVGAVGGGVAGFYLGATIPF